ncbi:hypothetical protein AGMMS49992_18470 [Clostridia bacterium]|nr:hypothetical protein AGMMS49992_18470 [Clostridia bacterium]
MSKPRFTDLDGLQAALLDARASLTTQVPVRLAKALTAETKGLGEGILAILASFDGSIQYSYGTIGRSDDLCVLFAFTYTPGTRIAHADQTGSTAGLSAAERQVYDTAKAWIISDACPKSNSLLTERAIHDWICNQTRYWDDPANTSGAALQDYQTAIGLFNDKRGNCMAYADSFLMLARMAGLDCDTIIGEGFNESGKWIGHAWNMVRIDGQWLMLDATYDDLNSEPFTVSYPYFNVDARTISADHRWKAEAMYRPVESQPSALYAYGNPLFPELRRVASADGFRDELRTALTDGGARELRFMLDGFSVSTEDISEWIKGWRPPNNWLMLHQELGANQYWAFQQMDRDNN